MILNPFKKNPKRILGIDIGTSSIKVVEVSQKNKKKILENYGEIDTLSFNETLLENTKAEISQILFSNQQTAEAISILLKETGIQTNKVNFSIPDFYSFFINFDLPPMSEKEISEAVKYEAKNYIPLSLSEVTLDWIIINNNKDKKNNSLKVLVNAIPNNIINQYQEIATMAGLKLQALEAEAFTLVKSLTKKDMGVTAIIDIGSRSTTCNIVENGILKTSHSFNISGNELTELLRKSLKIKYHQAEELKKEIGLRTDYEINGVLKEILFPLIDSIINEIKKFFQDFYQHENKLVEKIILAGGAALMPNLKEYFSEEIKKEVEIANPFIDFIYPPILTELLKKIGPSFAIAVGLTLQENRNIKN